MTVTSLTAELAEVCADVRAASVGDDVDGLVPSLLAAPASTEETAAVLGWAAERALVVVVRGAATKMGWGRPPERVDLVVDTTNMDRLVEHAAGDLIATAGAGLPLARLQEHLATAGQRLAVDEMVAGTTVGGLVAVTPSGPRRMASGSVRDLLIGLTVVRADGVVAHSGGKVVKNVAGYDLGKLMTGSFGTLGVLTEATFRLHPVAEATCWLGRPVGSAAQAGEVIAAVLHSQVVPAAVEVLWPTEGNGTVAVLLEGTSAGVDARSRVLGDLLGAGTEVIGQPAQLHSYPWQDVAGATGLKLTCQLSAVPDVLAAAGERGVHVQGSAGVGVLYGSLPAGTDARTLEATLRQLRTVCEANGGSVVVVDAPAETKAEVDVWGPVHGLELMRRVKDQFDPDRRLAPGRFVGGI